MAGVHVLLNSLMGGDKLEKTSTPRGEDVVDGSENAAEVFAVVLSGCMKLNVDSKGQKSSLADQDSEEKQSNANPVQIDQTTNGMGSMLGYGNFFLPFLTQMMLQGDLPVAKEVNSGESMSQGIKNSSLANAVFLHNMSGLAGKNLATTVLNPVSLDSNKGLASTGMTTLDPQGNNLGITELDKYREVISNLLVALSGEITDSTSEGNHFGVGSMGTKELRQELEKNVRDWMTMTDDVIKNDHSSDGQNALQRVLEGLAKGSRNGGNPELDTKAVNLLAALYSILREGDGSAKASAKVPQAVNEELINQLKVMGIGLESKDGQNQPLSTGAGVVTNVVPLTLANGKIIFEQISAVVREQVMNKQQALKELDIQLHSEDLGKMILREGDGSAKVSAKIPQAVNEELINQLKVMGIGLESIATGPKETVLPTNVQQKSEGLGPQDKANPLKSIELSATKDGQNQPLSTGAGVVTNVVPLTLADGKIIFEHISTVVREQVMNKQQAIKELDIQLHPEDLGKIRIFLRWENGQVHIQVNATEAATGQLLQNQLSELRQNLMSQGVNCGSLQMGQGGERQQQPQGDEAQRMFHQWNTLPSEDEELIPIINAHYLGQGGINRVNITA